MTQRKRLLAALALGAMALGGCGLQYNGALGTASRDWQAPPQPRTPRAASTVAPREAPAAAASIPASASAPAPAPADVLAEARLVSAGPSAARDGEPPVEGDRSAAAIRPLGLFGHLPAPGAETGPGRSSPLGSPENIRRITFAAEGADFDPAIDPTGQWLVYASTQHRPTADLYLKRINGTAVTQLTTDPGNDVMPAFSPDGRHIAFASDRSGHWDIYLMDATGGGGGQAIQLTNDPTHDIHPSFSPDGKRLVYCTYGAQSGQWEVVLIDLERPGTKRFIGYGLFPKWSPAGDRILFQRARERGTRWFSIWTVELVDGEAVRPTEIAASSNAALITPTWSPDGRHIAFCTVLDPAADQSTPPPQADIWVIGADGTGRVNLTHSPFANLQPTWGPDGSIYFVSSRAMGGRENIWSLRPDRALLMARSAEAAAPGSVSQHTPAAPGPLHDEPGASPAPALSAAPVIAAPRNAMPADDEPPAPERTAAAPTEN